MVTSKGLQKARRAALKAGAAKAPPEAKIRKEKRKGQRKKPRVVSKNKPSAANKDATDSEASSNDQKETTPQPAVLPQVQQKSNVPEINCDLQAIRKATANVPSTNLSLPDNSSLPPINMNTLHQNTLQQVQILQANLGLMLSSNLEQHNNNMGHFALPQSGFSAAQPPLLPPTQPVLANTRPLFSSPADFGHAAQSTVSLAQALPWLHPQAATALHLPFAAANMSPLQVLTQAPAMQFSPSQLLTFGGPFRPF